ncbi:MAG: PQQ-dependent sugar dehydrogenase, partial [Woeseiaceae bacterium]|nr:PQQ-dependent sugar dehydrogenase [Woeseiaceae bacterium]
MRKRVLAFFMISLMAAGAAAQSGLPFDVEVITDFDEPWAMAFLPDGRLLVTEKKGNLFVVLADGSKQAVRWTPDVDYGGQGGLGDVALHPDFENNGLVYLSYAEAGVGDTRG